MNIRDRVKELRRVRAGDLRPNPKNWRTHPKAQQDALRGILAEVGYADALLTRELADGSLELVDGHLRAETTPEQVVPVLVLDVSEQEADKLLVSIDPLAALAEADPGKLSALLKTVQTGSEALAEMFAGLGGLAGMEPAPGLSDPDQAPLPAAAAVSRRGDIWSLGSHRLMCGDSASPGDVDALLSGEPVHLVNTDPPYNVAVEPRSNNAIAAGNSSFTSGQKMHLQKFDKERGAGGKPTHSVLRAKDRQLANDAVSEEEFDRLLSAWFGNIDRLLIPGRAFYIWGGYSNHLNYRLALRQYALHFAQCIVWFKDHRVLGRKDFMSDHEWCYYGWKEGAAHEFFGPSNIGDVWQVKKVPGQAMVHLTEKPVELAVRAISYSSRPGETVLDLFGGSGSTLIACEQMGRSGRLMELDPLYCDVIIQRWQAFTGKAATLAQAAEDPKARPARGAKARPLTGQTFEQVAKDRKVDLATAGQAAKAAKDDGDDRGPVDGGPH